MREWVRCRYSRCTVKRDRQLRRKDYGRRDKPLPSWGKISFVRAPRDVTSAELVQPMNVSTLRTAFLTSRPVHINHSMTHQAQ